MPVLCTLSLSLSLSLWLLASYHALLVKNCDCKHQWFWIVVWMRERYLHTFANGERERIKKTLGKQNHKTKLDRSGMDEKAGRRNREKKIERTNDMLNTSNGNGNNSRGNPMANGYMRTTHINIAQRNTNWKSFLHSKTFVKFPIISTRSTASTTIIAVVVVVVATASPSPSSHRCKPLLNWCNFCFIVFRCVPSHRHLFWSWIDLTNEHHVNDSNFETPREKSGQQQTAARQVWESDNPDPIECGTK